jgi:hypothetical protein
MYTRETGRRRESLQERADDLPRPGGRAAEVAAEQLPEVDVGSRHEGIQARGVIPGIPRGEIRRENARTPLPVRPPATPDDGVGGRQPALERERPEHGVPVTLVVPEQDVQRAVDIGSQRGGAVGFDPSPTSLHCPRRAGRARPRAPGGC